MLVNCFLPIANSVAKRCCSLVIALELALPVGSDGADLSYLHTFWSAFSAWTPRAFGCWRNAGDGSPFAIKWPRPVGAFSLVRASAALHTTVAGTRAPRWASTAEMLRQYI